MLVSLYFVFALFFYSVAGKNEEYRGYKVYNIEFDTQSQQDKLFLLKSDLIDFWRKPNYKYGVVGKVMVPPSHFNWFEERLRELEITRDVYIEDVYEYLNEEESKRTRSLRDDGEETDSPFDIKGYHRYEDILTHLRSLEERYIDPNYKVELVQYGITEQNRPLVYTRVTNTNTAAEKPIVVIEAAINPREWITIPAALNVVEKVLEERRFLDDIEWIVIPVLNPDGYEYTHTNLRLWAKSRSTRSNLGVICPGVNINRNFDVDWLNFDSSSSACSHLYGGIETFSEIETQMIRSIIQENGSRIKLYISLQNNGGFISYPWNYERAASGMFRQQHLLGLNMIRSMEETYNLDVGSVIFDRASGTSGDYARTNDVPYTYTIDVVQSDYGVVIPEEQIGDIIDDVWRAVSVAANEMIRLYA